MTPKIHFPPDTQAQRLATLTLQLHQARQDAAVFAQTARDTAALAQLVTVSSKGIHRKLMDKWVTQAINASGLFDGQWYLENNPDVASAELSAVEHFATAGLFEGRRPNSGRVVLTHLEQQLQAQADELEATGLFDTEWYMARYPDVALTGIPAIKHYILFGASGLWDPSPNFSSSAYLACYPDLTPDKINPLLHYARDGHAEGRWSFTPGRPLSLTAKAQAPAPTPTSHILFISHNLNPNEGAPISLLQLTRGLKAQNLCKPILFALQPGPLEQAYRDSDIPVILATGSTTGDQGLPLHDIHTAEAALVQVLSTGNIGAVVTNTSLSLWCAQIAQKMGLPSLAILRENSATYARFETGVTWLRGPSREGLLGAHKAVFVSQDTRDLWLHTHPELNSTLIPNGIDTDRLPPISPADAAGRRAQHGIAPTDLVYINIGSFSPRKAQADLVTAFAALPGPTLNRSHLILIGDTGTGYSKGLHTQIAALPISVQNRIHRQPPTMTPEHWYQLADIFVFSSHNESYPRTIIEAMHFGLPIATSHIPGVLEQIEPEVSALTFPAGETQAMTLAMERLALHPALRIALARMAQDRLQDLTSYSQMIALYGHEISYLCASPYEAV